MADWVSIIKEQYAADVKNGTYPKDWAFAPTAESIDLAFKSIFKKSLAEMNATADVPKGWKPAGLSMYRTREQGYVQAAVEEQKKLHPAEADADQKARLEALKKQQESSTATFTTGGAVKK